MNARLKIAPPGTITLDLDRQLPPGIWSGSCRMDFVFLDFGI
ncbi:hypothetical protein NC99_12620 [Sunxiuqinia dokdonensis]|uniref:Uncharacterized protein n=1 Tax=Sunxiuqinia dokdonensis TaxID=1409788 RepID=A0A0L8VC54_9BACT|nr:hypothetical protein NC99_12620 [Sunxiuqinia dokdonensis]